MCWQAVVQSTYFPCSARLSARSLRRQWKRCHAPWLMPWIGHDSLQSVLLPWQFVSLSRLRFRFCSCSLPPFLCFPISFNAANDTDPSLLSFCHWCRTSDFFTFACRDGWVSQPVTLQKLSSKMESSNFESRGSVSATCSLSFFDCLATPNPREEHRRASRHIGKIRIDAGSTSRWYQ